MLFLFFAGVATLWISSFTMGVSAERERKHRRALPVWKVLAGRTDDA